MSEHPSEQLDEMINVASTQSHVNYSFKPAAHSSSSSSSEEEPSPSAAAAAVAEAKNKRQRLEEEEEEQQEWEDDDRPSGLKTMGAVLVVLFIVAAIVVVIGYTTWKAGHEKHKAPPALLWTEQHITLSQPVNLAYSQPLLSGLESALASRLLESPRHFPCLCMHHLQYPWSPSLEYPLNAVAALNEKLNGQPHSYQVCGVASFGPTEEVVLLVNPTLQGRGNISDTYTERSVSCPNGSVQQRQRFRTIFLEWQDLDGQMVWSRFEGPVAACLQLALDEMLLGNKHC